MAYEVEQETVEPQRILSVRGPVPIESISSGIAQRTRTVLQHLLRAGAEPAGPPFTRYHEVGEEWVDLEVGFPVDEPLEGADEVDAGRLPGGEVISTVHRGPYEGLTGAGEALDRWLEENGREARGPSWEIYRVHAGDVEDPSDFETDVVRPIR